MNKDRFLALMNTIIFLMVILVNYLAVTLPLNGKTTGELSDQFPNLFTPADFTFSIWGIIYLFLSIFIVCQFLVLLKNHSAVVSIQAISPYFIVNCMANALWLYAWHYQLITFSVAIMFVMLITLIIIHEKLGLALAWKNLVLKICLDVPFSLYLGWISIATIANIAVLLVANNIHPFGLSDTACTLSVLAMATLITLLMVAFKRNIAFALVVCWALFGIIIKQKEEGGPGSEDIVLVSHIFMAVIILAVLVLMAILLRKVRDHKLPSGG